MRKTEKYFIINEQYNFKIVILLKGLNMKRILLLFLSLIIFAPLTFAIEYKKMQFQDAITGETVIEECGYNSNGVLRCKGDTVPDDYVPTKYSTGYNYQTGQSYTVIEKGKNTTVYSQGKKIYSQQKR